MWRKVKLYEVCDVRRGTTITKKNTIDGVVPVIGGGTKPTYFHNKANKEAGCITVSGSGASAGYVNYWDVPIFASDCSTIEVKSEETLQRFVYYFMQAQQQYIYENFRSGAAQPHVYAKNIATLDFPVIPLAEQQRIVAKLDAAFAEIDEALLSINHKCILAKQLVSRTISSVFSQIDDSELKHTTLGEVTYTAGRIGWKGLTKKEYVDEGRLFLSVHGLNYGKFVDFRDAFRITQARYDESPEIMLKKGDILLCKDGAGIGKLGVVGKLPEPATINSSLLLIRPSEQLTTDYIYYSLLSSEFQSVIQSKIDGATTPHLYQRDINQFQFSLPSLQIQMEITEKISSALLEIQKIQSSFATNIKNYELLKKALLAQELQRDAA